MLDRSPGRPLMTDARAEGRPAGADPETPAGRPATAVGLTGQLRWAWRTLTSMRTALILLFLLALGAFPGSMLPQEGTDPASVDQYFTAHPALAPWLNHLGLFNVFAAPWFAAIYILLFASLVGLRGAADVQAGRFGSDASAAGAAQRGPVAALGRLRQRLPPARRPKWRRKCWPATASGCAPAATIRRHDGTGSPPRRATCAKQATCCSTWHCSACWSRSRWAGCSATRPTSCWCRASASPTPSSRLDEFYPGRFVTSNDLAPFSITLNKFDASYITSGAQRGQPSAFDAQVSYTATPAGR